MGLGEEENKKLTFHFGGSWGSPIGGAQLGEPNTTVNHHFHRLVISDFDKKKVYENVGLDEIYKLKLVPDHQG